MLNIIGIGLYIIFGTVAVLAICALGITLYTDVKDEWDYKNGK
jgi:hypothetical protein